MCLRLFHCIYFSLLSSGTIVRHLSGKKDCIWILTSHFPSIAVGSKICKWKWTEPCDFFNSRWSTWGSSCGKNMVSLRFFWYHEHCSLPFYVVVLLQLWYKSWCIFPCIDISSSHFMVLIMIDTILIHYFMIPFEEKHWLSIYCLIFLFFRLFCVK